MHFHESNILQISYSQPKERENCTHKIFVVSLKMLAKFKATFQDFFEHFEDGGISAGQFSLFSERSMPL